MANMISAIPVNLSSDEELDEFLAQPYNSTVEMMQRLDGDIMILGVAGKMGPSLARLALRASRLAGVSKRIIGVARFSDPDQRTALHEAGVETIQCDLSDIEAVRQLPKAENILFLAGRKFGSVGSESLTWIMNVVVPANVAQTFPGSRIVAFSTGCVYALTSPESGGSTEQDAPAPIGEYANSCLGRERVFEYYSESRGIPTAIYRLNYAIDLRYGVLADVAQRVAADQTVDLNVSAANVIWQGDANNRALLCLELASSPARAINITGPETISIRDVAEEFGRLFGKKVTFAGTPAGKYYLSNAAASTNLFGPPRVTLQQMITWTADWFRAGGRNLGKPTHFSVTDGQFLD